MSESDGKSVRERVKQAFQPQEKEPVWQYILVLRDSQKILASTLRRTSLLVILSVAAFELLARGDLQGFTVGPLDVAPSRLVLAGVPVLIAYLVLAMVFETLRFEQLGAANAALYEIWDSEAEANDLDVLVEPVLPIFWAAGSNMHDDVMTDSDRTELRIMNILFGVVALGALVYQIRAYMVVGIEIGVDSVLFWASLVASVALVVAGGWLLVANDSSPSDDLKSEPLH